MPALKNITVFLKCESCAVPREEEIYLIKVWMKQILANFGQIITTYSIKQ